MNTIAKYQARRRLFLKIIPIFFAIFFLCVVFALTMSIESVALFLVALLSVGMAIAAQLLINRCPSCGKPQFNTIKIKGKLLRTRGWNLNPYSCPWCKAKLRD